MSKAEIKRILETKFRATVRISKDGAITWKKKGWSNPMVFGHYDSAAIHRQVSTIRDELYGA